MEIPLCRKQTLLVCTELQKEKLCSVYTRKGVKRCRKYRKSRPLTPENVMPERDAPRQVNVMPEAQKPRSANVIVERQANVIRELEESTLEKVQKVYGGEEGAILAEDIDELERDPQRATAALVKNITLRNALLQLIDGADTVLEDSFRYIDLYEKLTSKALMRLMPSIEINGALLKRELLINLEKGPASYYETIDSAIESALEPRRSNSSTVVMSAKNAERTQFMEDLGITSYESIIRNFKEFKILPKTSSSDSIVLRAEFKPPSDSINSIREYGILEKIPLYLKIFPTKVQYSGYARGEKDISADGLEFEQFAYNQLFKLVQFNITPNILCKVATSMISGFNADFLENPAISSIKSEIQAQVSVFNTQNHVNSKARWLQTGVIITQPGDKTFHAEIKNLTNEERCQVMFQLMYTLYVFEKIEFSHGDLHTGNIFIINLLEERELCYVIEGQVFRFRTKKLVKIYDFDHGALCKETSFRYNRTNSFKIEKRLNRIRDTDSSFNTNYAETNIFNKNLDLIIFMSSLTFVFPRMFTKFNMIQTDPQFNMFFEECLPGFNSANPISGQTIGDTYYLRLLHPAEMTEANRIFGININDPAAWKNYRVSDQISNMTWIDYFKELKEDGRFSRIVKNFGGWVPNNHLWIPDEIVLPKLQMLTNGYFNSLRSDVPIDIRKEIVYTMDNR